jgi:anthranilate phosphoribosyltransferase
LGVRTVFNILGPLSNPAEPPFHLMGAYNLETAQLIADTLSGMQMERAFVVHGEPGWDEATPVGPFTCFDVRPGSVTSCVRHAEEFGLRTCTADELKGGDAAYNAQRLRAVFDGEDRGPHRDALVLNAALVLELTGHAQTPIEAAQLAANAVESGQARTFLQKLAAFGARFSV